MARWKAGAGMRRRSGSGRPSRLDARLSERLSNLVVAKPNASSKTLAHLININRADPITDRSIRNYRRQLGFHPVHRRHAPVLTIDNMADRLAFCRNHLHDDIKTWVFSDEAGVVAEHDGSVHWIRDGEERPIQERKGHPAKVNFWAMVWWDGWTEPVFYDGAMNGAVYLDILQHHAAAHLAGRQLTLIQDRASFHRTKAISDYLNQANITLMDDFPPYSPDLNAIEAVWGWLKARVGRNPCHTKPELKQAIRDAWRELPLETMRGWFRHVPNVMRQIIEAKGGHSK
jgi:putative transposase